MSLKKLTKAAKKRKDNFPINTVVRWTASARYAYAAIKTPVGWFTTARTGNTFVPQVITFEELLSIVSRSETSQVEVADIWYTVG